MEIIKAHSSVSYKPKLMTGRVVVADIEDLPAPLPSGYQTKTINHIRMSEREINMFIVVLSTSLDSLQPEVGFTQCRSWFDRPYFEQTEDRRFKDALVNFLFQRFGTRMPLWVAMHQRDPSVSDLI